MLRWNLLRALPVCLGLCICHPVWAEAPPEEGPNAAPGRISGWNVQFSLYTRHWDPSPEHNDHQRMITLEARLRDQWLAGLSLFDNSFDQPTQLVYVGRTWPLFGSPHFYLKLIGGLIHGYKEPYEDKIPFNGLGVAPAIVPSLGYRHRRVLVEVHFAGFAAMTVTAGVSF
jgi:hypothetical protein